MNVVFDKKSAERIGETVRTVESMTSDNHYRKKLRFGGSKSKYNFQVISDKDFEPAGNERRLAVRGGTWDFGIPKGLNSLEIETAADIGDFAGTGGSYADLATTTIEIADGETKYLAAFLSTSTGEGLTSATVLAVKHFDTRVSEYSESGDTAVAIKHLAKVENDEGTLTITPEWFGGNLLSIVEHTNPSAFYPTNSTEIGKVNIAAGSWYMNGGKIDYAGATGLGTSGTPYIVATITHGTANPLIPATIAVAAQAALATALEFPTKRNICKINYSGADVSSIDRLQVGDIYQNLNAFEVSAGVWEDGESDGSNYIDVTSDEQYDSATHKYQVKKTRFMIKNGVLYIGEEESSWTDVFTAVDCS